MGFIGAIGSFAAQKYQLIDWWKPVTITHTPRGIEDLLLGFSNAGIATVLYVEIAKKRLYHRRKGDHSTGLTLLCLLTIFIFWFCFNRLQAGTFLSMMVALLIYSGVMLVIRKDLLTSSLANGALMVILAVPIYMVLSWLSPGAAEKIYIYPLITGVEFNHVPLEEFIFYFVFGVMVALMYEYWQGLRLRNYALAYSKPKDTRRK